MTTTTAPIASTRGVSADCAGRVCDGLIEAARLVAVVVVPLVFNQHALVSFGLYKAAMVTLLAAITAAAWATKAFLNKSFAGTNGLPSRPVGIALAALLGAQLLATLFSVNPSASLWGGLETSEGLLTAVANAVLFLAAACCLRRAVQIERLVTAIVAASFPVALYALIQRAGFDPIPFAGGEARVFSTMGHPIYLAGFLLMVMPLTWWKIAREACQLGATGHRRTGYLLLYAGVCVVQMAGFASAQSRGPMLGLMAAAVFFGLGCAVHARRRQWLLRIGAVLGVMAAVFVFLNLPLSSSMNVARVLGIKRFADTLGLRKGPDPYRKAHWDAAVALMTSPNPIIFPNGGTDRWHALRPWIGYGPETLENVLPERYIWPGTNAKTENRLHNRVLDLWFSTGLFGALAFYTFFVLVFQRGLRQIGLTSRRSAFLIIPVCALAGSALFWAFWGRGFFALGMIAGLVAGCAISLLASTRTTEVPSLGNSKNTTDGAILIIALLAALVGHLLETAFAFTVPATSLLFWLYAAMVVALASIEDSTPEAVIPSSAKSGRRRVPASQTTDGVGWWEAGLAACGPTLILVTLLFVFVQMYSFDSVSWTTVLARTLTQIKGDQGPSHLVWFLFIPTWLTTTFAFAEGKEKNRALRFGISLMISAVITGAYAILKGVQIAGIGAVPRPGDPSTTAVAKIAGYHGVYFTFVGLIVVLVLATASILNSVNGNGAKFSFRQTIPNLAAIGLGLGVGWFLVLRGIRADITATWGQALQSFGRLEDSTEVLHRSVLEKPDAHAYRIELGGVLIQRADASRNFESFDWLCREAETVLLPAALEAHGLNTAGNGLARLYMAWAAATPGADQRLARAQQAAAYFQRAQIFMPGHVLSWMDSAVLDQFLHQPAEADRKLARAAEVMNGRAGYWANFYREQSMSSTTPEMRQANAAVAFRLFAMAIRDTEQTADAAVLQLQRATLNLGLGRLGEARQECLKAQPALPAAERWQAEAFLAEIDRQTGDLAGARTHMEKAVEVAPAETKAALLKLKATLDAH